LFLTTVIRYLLGRVDAWRNLLGNTDDIPLLICVRNPADTRDIPTRDKRVTIISYHSIAYTKFNILTRYTCTSKSIEEA